MQEKARFIFSALETEGLDVFAPGAQDYNLGMDFLKGLTANSKVHLVSTNVLFEGKQPFSPYVIVEKAGLKIAVLSLTPPGKIEDKRFTVKGAEETLAQYLPEVTPKADLIILLSQFNVRENEPIAEKYSKIQLIVGADEKTNLEEPLWFYGHTLVMDPHFNGFLLGKLDLVYKTPFKGFYSLATIKKNLANKASLEKRLKEYPDNETVKDLLARAEKEDSLAEIPDGSLYTHELVRLDEKRYGKANAVTAGINQLKEKVRKRALEE